MRGKRNQAFELRDRCFAMKCFKAFQIMLGNPGNPKTRSVNASFMKFAKGAIFFKMGT